jgi:integrase
MRCWWNARWWNLGPVAEESAWKAEYARLVAMWSVDPTAAPLKAGEYLVTELCRDDLASADAPDGDRRRVVAGVIDLLLDHHAGTPVLEFGPLALRSCQSHLCSMPDPNDPKRTRFGRSTVVAFVGIVRAIWKWGVSTERIPSERYDALAAVPGPKTGSVRGAKVVEPANPEAVKSAAAVMRPPVRALVLLEWATGARPTELCGMQCGEIHRTGRLYIPGIGLQDLDAEKVWVYAPAKHKSAHKGKSRFVVFGPAEQQLFAPFLDGRRPEEFVFRPSDGLAHLRAERAARGGGSGGNRKKSKATPKRRPGMRYTRQTYYQAVVRACDKAGVERWFPYQLRHLAASEIKAMFDVDAVTAVLGQYTRAMGEHYGGRSFKKAAEIARGRTVGE